ncbi:hypothetical protein [Streptomyces sp. NPDC001530]|uniref:hypothetical protein n=1 Tax=Streptomyces sp. NPDC001530 TaxID=3364582 RepID=UPI0036BD20BD
MSTGGPVSSSASGRSTAPSSPRPTAPSSGSPPRWWHPRVSDEVFAEARRFLSDRELVELLQVAGYYWSFGRIATGLNVEVTKVYDDEPVLSTGA